MNTVWIIHALLFAQKNAEGAEGKKNKGDKHGWTSLHVAVASGNKGEVEKLLQKRDQDLINGGNEDGWTPLHLAAALNNPDIVKTLLPSKKEQAEEDTKADPNAQSKSGCTPLHVAAATTCCPKIVRLLLEHGADPWLRNKKGQLPFDLAEKNKKLQGTPVYWRLQRATYLPWHPPAAAPGSGSA